MDKKGRETKEKKNIRYRKRKRLVFLAEWAILCAFILAAFFLPQGIFHIQDNILYGRTMLSAREKIDVEALSTTYERSLPLRMLHFAECLEAGDHFYVTAQDIPITQEMYDYLYSGSFFDEGIVAYFSNVGLLSLEFREGIVNQWKQYVIYSDDYTKGVNFILWYIELQDREGEILKILADAETGIIYALKEENSYYAHNWIMGGYNSQDGLSCYEHSGVVTWYALAEYYDVVTQEDIETFFAGYNVINENELEIETLRKMESEELGRYLLEYFYVFDGIRREFWTDNQRFPEEKNMFSFQLIYESMPFEFVMDMREVGIFENGVYIFPDVTMGFQQIYELIPEFNQPSDKADFQDGDL